MIVFVDKVRFLRIAVHLQADFLVGVFQLAGRDQVVSLHVGQVVHSLCVAGLPLVLPVDVPQRQPHHAQQHQQRHQPHRQRHRRPLEAVLAALSLHLGGDGDRDLASESAVAGGADAGGRGLARPAAPGADAPVAAGLKGALVQDPVAVAAAVACGTAAAVVIDPVLAGAPVEAGASGALVDVDFALVAGKSCSAAAHTCPAVDQAQAT